MTEGGRDVQLILGAMNFGKRTAEPEASRIVDRALDAGVVRVDTANAYVDGESERIVGRAIRGRRDRFVISTKVGLLRTGGELTGLMRIGGHAEGLSRRRILAACDESLDRLETDYIDVYHLHAPDVATPIEESLSAIAELLRSGKIRAFGVSNYASWQILEMVAWCDREHVARPVIAQQIYNLLVRQLDVEYLAFASKYGVKTAAYNPLAGGLLTDREAAAEPVAGSRFDGNPMYQRRYWTPRLRAAAADYAELARELGMPLTDLAYAFLASRPGIDAIVVGPGSLLHLEAALRGYERRLDPEILSRVDALHRELQGTDAVYARI